MVGDVLESVEVVGRTLGDFTQHEASVALATREVSAFAIRSGAFGDFHEEGKSALPEPGEESGVDGGAEVVAVGDEKVFDAFAGEALQ